MAEDPLRPLRRAERAWRAEARISGCMLWLYGLMGLIVLGIVGIVLYALLGVVGVVLAVLLGVVAALLLRALIRWAS